MFFVKSPNKALEPGDVVTFQTKIIWSHHVVGLFV